VYCSRGEKNRQKRNPHRDLAGGKASGRFVRSLRGRKREQLSDHGGAIQSYS